jgi:hypothetical protein
MVTRETIGYTMKTKYRKTLQLYIKIPIIKYIVHVLYKIKSSQMTLDKILHIDHVKNTKS